MKASSFIPPFVVIAVAGCAYFAGQYVGRSDTERRLAQADQLQRSTESADRLFIAGAVAEYLKAGQSDEALRVTEQYAGLQASVVKECLANPGCSGWIASTDERRNRLKALAERYSNEPSNR